ncbi:Zn-ribbon domain-containing OB-fold protein [Kineobactrum salinum]|uniref:OB-fold domain-containing protein n=1 Tax=Kineobactrum salinum TaxID=2708301 RepID=A0A6C0U1E9_9GAMM|nr:OB-fold domain-containing protein [Kineobactrum salinum]QIB65952.1 OB-fold domain-containing protein [Kineobactrum salinum]
MSNSYIPTDGSGPESEDADEVSSLANYYLPAGLPGPLIGPNDLYAPYWNGTRDEKLMIQRNPSTGVYQWPPQWITHDTQSFDIDWVQVEGKGVLYSWTRVWHPVHPILKDSCPYIVVVVELPHAGGIRMLGNLLGDPQQDVEIGAELEAVFEHHNDASQPFTLVQWRKIA